LRTYMYTYDIHMVDGGIKLRAGAGIVEARSIFDACGKIQYEKDLLLRNDPEISYVDVIEIVKEKDR